MSVSAEIAQHMFWPAERPFGVDDPVVAEQYPQPREAKARGSASGKRWPWNWSVPSREAVFSAATNLPRNTRLSTLTGRKRSGGRRSSERDLERGRQRRQRSEHGDDAAVADPQYGAR